jgi:hypothetical protein
MLRKTFLLLAVLPPCGFFFHDIRSLAPAPENEFHFSIIGDRAGPPEPQVYGRVLLEVALLHPAFAITVGDAIPGNHDAKLDAEWAAFHKMSARYPS